MLDITRKKKKKHDKILMLAESKFNSIKTLMLQTLGDLDITHEELTMILKENLVSENEDEQQETIKLSKKKIK